VLNIYGEKVTLTKAQRREYVALLQGPAMADWRSTQHKILERLVDKGLVKTTLVIANVTRFERWM
jgi:hypothetical protein